MKEFPQFEVQSSLLITPMWNRFAITFFDELITL